ncbi:MAG: phage/plasmid primase, P4 family, partial [Actinomycetota bacterium]|nr:phage/plasmid primase, P4 family [Actinomycetota bacterium]
VHPDGERYVWDADGALEPAEVDPEELRTRCIGLATATVLARHVPPVGGRHHFAMALAGFLLGPGRLGEEATLAVLEAAWHAAGADGPEAIDDLRSIVRNTAEKLSSGGEVTGGPTLEEAAPGLPALLARWLRRSAEAGAGVEGLQAVSGGSGGEPGPTHDELRDRWIAGQDAPMAYGQGEWRKYEAGFWTGVHEQTVFAGIDAVLEAAKPEGTRPTAGARSSVERLARAKLFVPDEVWDAKEDVLVCQNGALEISSMTLREHRADDYALGAVQFGYDPEAKSPTFDAFLASTVPDAAPFLQEFVGYALTPDTSLEMAVWLQGPPGSGKSTFIEAIKAVLGPRCGILGLADVERSRFALSKIPGKTLLTATEQPADFIASTHVLNALISGEEVQAEEKFKPSYTVIPRAKLLWGMNTLPRIKDANSGLFRRVTVVSFPPLRVERDPELKDKIKAEAPGILNWALEGLRRLRERGRFEPPEVVRTATEGFHEANDVPTMFVREACVVSDAAGCEERAGALYEAYRHWCRVNGHKPLSSTAVASEWARLGFGSRNLNGRRLYTGVKVDAGWIRVQEEYPRR